jgi:hypothetical protein
MTSRLLVDKIEGKTTSGSIQMPQGHVIQTVQNHLTGNHRTSVTSTSFASTQVTGQITPKFATSHIKVSITTTGNNNQTDGTGIYATLYRGSTDLGASGTTGFSTVDGRTNIRIHTPLVINFIDTPSTTDTLTYTVYIKSTTGSAVEVPAYTSANTTVIMQEIAQ